MPSQYLAGADLLAYGVSGATLAQVTQASAIVDSFLQRKEGCVWAVDFNGDPCYMAALSPLVTLTNTAAIFPGPSVVVPYVGATLGVENIGDVVVIDRGTPMSTEACVISAISSGTLTLLSVKTSHAASTTVDLGLHIYEQVGLPSNRSIARVAKFPNIRLLSGMGRYGYGRRTDQFRGQFAEFNLLATVQSFGGPPQWIPWDVTQADIASTTGEIWVPAGLLLSYFSEVRLRYVAGWSAASLPAQIKQATAQIILAMGDIPLTAAVKGVRDDTTGLAVARFGPTLVSADTANMLTPFCARCWA